MPRGSRPVFRSGSARRPAAPTNYRSPSPGCVRKLPRGWSCRLANPPPPPPPPPGGGGGRRAATTPPPHPGGGGVVSPGPATPPPPEGGGGATREARAGGGLDAALRWLEEEVGLSEPA